MGVWLILSSARVLIQRNTSARNVFRTTQKKIWWKNIFNSVKIMKHSGVAKGGFHGFRFPVSVKSLIVTRAIPSHARKTSGTQQRRSERLPTCIVIQTNNRHFRDVIIRLGRLNRSENNMAKCVVRNSRLWQIRYVSKED